MKKIFLIVLMIAENPFSLMAQSSSSVKSFNIPLSNTVELRSGSNDPEVLLEHRMLPKPHPGTDRKKVQQVKRELEKYRKDHTDHFNQRSGMFVNSPVLVRNFMGNAFNGYVPNDNDMAISNNDVVCSVTNTTIWHRDLTTGTSYGSFNLHVLSSALGLQQEEFDPKIMYDPVADRFIFVCLNGFTDTTSNVVVGFSQTASSYGQWNFYSLPGNPLNNNLWTDFPMLAITNNEVFITANLLYNDSTWQAGFNQTIVWQINKNEGYSGQTLNPLLHYNIHHNNEPIRNLCPVKGGSTLYGPDMNFLSNRNFTSGNDTIFLVNISGAIGPPAPTLTVTPVVSNVEYRMPIDAVQPYPDLLIVNDARMMGAFLENNKIQMVCGTTDTLTGRSAVFHGTMDISGIPTLNAWVYAIDTLYLGYPNIAYAGNGPGNDRAIISILASSPTFKPGTGAYQTDGNGDFSPLTVVKTGISYVNMLAGPERWGDYTGCQTKYNLPGWVWVSGGFSQANHTTRTWIGELAGNSGVSVPELNAQDESAILVPNPAGERFEIRFDLKNDAGIRVNVFDTQGRLISELYRGRLSGGANRLSFRTSFLKPGSYLVKMTDDSGGVVAVKKLVVR